MADSKRLWSIPIMPAMRTMVVLPNHMRKFISAIIPRTVTRLERYFRGTVYDVTVRRGNAPGMTVNGKPVESNKAPLTG